MAQRIAGLCRIVFATAFDQYAVEAFEREAVDYLLKPVSKERLLQTIKSLTNQLDASSEPPAGLAGIVEQLLSNPTGKGTTDFLRWIKAQHKDSIRLIPVEDVYYFRAEDKYTVVITKEGESLILNFYRSILFVCLQIYKY